jgi:hypothetical protein
VWLALRPADLRQVSGLCLLLAVRFWSCRFFLWASVSHSVKGYKLPWGCNGIRPLSGKLGSSVLFPPQPCWPPPRGEWPGLTMLGPRTLRVLGLGRKGLNPASPLRGPSHRPSLNALCGESDVRPSSFSMPGPGLIDSELTIQFPSAALQTHSGIGGQSPSGLAFGALVGVLSSE